MAATRCEYLVDIEAVIAPNGLPYASFVDGCLGRCARSWNGPQKEGTGIGVLATTHGPRLCKNVCWRYRGADRATFDPVAAVTFAQSPEQIAASLEHADISAREQALIEEATKSRLDAVEH